MPRLFKLLSATLLLSAVIGCSDGCTANKLQDKAQAESSTAVEAVNAAAGADGLLSPTEASSLSPEDFDSPQAERTYYETFVFPRLRDYAAARPDAQDDVDRFIRSVNYRLAAFENQSTE